MNRTVANAYALAWADPAGRKDNRPDERTYRKDFLYESLTKARYSDPVLFQRLAAIGKAFADRFPNDASALAYSAYCDALALDWIAASRKMRRVIELESGRNLDSWIDLGHFLRKVPGCEDESRNILLDPVSQVRT